MATRRDPTGPNLRTLKRLFALSGNRCAFPRCAEVIIQERTVVGKICHIKAAKAGGPRYDPEQTAAERHGYDNLVLLCGKHHTVIDDDEEAYTVERVMKMKADHECRAARVDDELAKLAAQLLIDQQPVISLNQSGGITAHTINLHSTVVAAQQQADTAQQPLFERRYAIYNCARELITLLENEGYKDEFEPTSISPYLRTLDDANFFFPDHICKFLRALQDDCEGLALAYGDVKRTKYGPERSSLGQAIGDRTARLHKLYRRMPTLFAEMLGLHKL